MRLSKFLGTDNLIISPETRIEKADERYLPVYIGYFFIALSVPNWMLFLLVFILIAIFIYSSQASYYNPAFSLLGYSHYELTDTTTNEKRLVISKKDLRKIDKCESFCVQRIDDSSFLERDKNDE